MAKELTLEGFLDEVYDEVLEKAYEKTTGTKPRGSDLRYRFYHTWLGRIQHYLRGTALMAARDLIGPRHEDFDISKTILTEADLTDLKTMTKSRFVRRFIRGTEEPAYNHNESRLYEEIDRHMAKYFSRD